jgi:spore coat polysaccharide biosynthesis protein SpsF (cytidylyltransferase family)
LDDVAGRFIEVLDAFPFQAFIRICGDSPLMDPGMVDQGVEIYRELDARGRLVDVVTNVWDSRGPRPSPAGLAVEIVRAATFRRAYRRINRPEDLEHVTKYLYDHAVDPELDLDIVTFGGESSHSQVELTVDTGDDLVVFELMIRRMDRDHTTYSLDEIVSLYKEVTGWAAP